MRASLVAVVLSGCVGGGALSALEVRQHSTRTWRGDTDDVYDATWLSLAGRGFEVKEANRLAGTLEASRDGRRWEVDVAALGTDQRVTLEPATPVTRAELGVVLDGLEEDTARLLAAWKDLPEWKYDGRRNLLFVPGFACAPPREWEWLDFEVSRRDVTVQRLRSRTGLNATLLVEVDRARPVSRVAESGKRAMGLALGARQRLTFPDELRQGLVRALDGNNPVEVAWFGHEETLGPVQVRLSMGCPGNELEACGEAWRAVKASVQTSLSPWGEGWGEGKPSRR